MSYLKGVEKMQITHELAQPIIKQITSVVGHNINIMNHDGVIVASSDSQRINVVHQGAKEVMEMKSERIIYPSESGNLIGTKPGVNLPILLHHHCIGTVGITGDPGDVYNIARIVKITVEALLQQNYLNDQLRYKRKIIEQWVFDLINQNFTNFNDLTDRAHFLNIDVEKLCTIFLFEIKELPHNAPFYKKLSEKQNHILQVVGLYFSPFFITYINENQFIAAFPANINNGLNETMQLANRVYKKLSNEYLDIRIGIGTPQKTVIGYRESYLEALHSLQMINKLHYPKKIMHINEWGITKLLDTIPKEYKDTYLEEFPTLNQQCLDSELQSTLEIFLNLNLSIELTSKKLKVHRNTVTYRLDKIKQLCGLNPRSFNDAVQLKILLFFLKTRSN
jgi:carbohydrate diacid regulator